MDADFGEFLAAPAVSSAQAQANSRAGEVAAPPAPSGVKSFTGPLPLDLFSEPAGPEQPWQLDQDDWRQFSAAQAPPQHPVAGGGSAQAGERCAGGSDGSSSTTLFSKGSAVWYLCRDGSWAGTTVVSVDQTLHPPSYGVEVDGNFRETEGHRLRPRLPGQPPPPRQQPGRSPGASRTATAVAAGLENGGWHQPAPAAEQVQVPVHQQQQQVEEEDEFGEFEAAPTLSPLRPTAPLAAAPSAVQAWGAPAPLPGLSGLNQVQAMGQQALQPVRQGPTQQGATQQGAAAPPASPQSPRAAPSAKTSPEVQKFRSFLHFAAPLAADKLESEEQQEQERQAAGKGPATSPPAAAAAAAMAATSPTQAAAAGAAQQPMAGLGLRSAPLPLSLFGEEEEEQQQEEGMAAVKQQQLESGAAEGWEGEDDFEEFVAAAPVVPTSSVITQPGAASVASPAVPGAAGKAEQPKPHQSAASSTPPTPDTAAELHGLPQAAAKPRGQVEQQEQQAEKDGNREVPASAAMPLQGSPVTPVVEEQPALQVASPEPASLAQPPASVEAAAHEKQAPAAEHGTVDAAQGPAAEQLPQALEELASGDIRAQQAAAFELTRQQQHQQHEQPPPAPAVASPSAAAQPVAPPAAVPAPAPAQPPAVAASRRSSIPLLALLRPAGSRGSSMAGSPPGGAATPQSTCSALAGGPPLGAGAPVTEYADAWELLLEAAAELLELGSRLWAEACAAGCQGELLAHPAAQAHLAALAQVYVAAAVVRLAAQQLGLFGLVEDLRQAWVRCEAAWGALPAAAAGAARGPAVHADAEQAAPSGPIQAGTAGEAQSEQQQEEGPAGRQAPAAGSAAHTSRDGEPEHPLAFRRVVLQASIAHAAAAASTAGKPTDPAALLDLLAAADSRLAQLGPDDFPRMLAWSEGLCGLSLLPLSMFESVPVELCAAAGRPALAPLARLWAGRLRGRALELE